MERKNGYVRVNLTELKRQMAKEWIEENVPIEITFNGEVIAKLVPKTWRDPRFLADLYERFPVKMYES